MEPIAEGTLLWSPPEALQRTCAMRAYMNWLHERHGLTFTDYAALWEWSVRDVETFWDSIIAFGDIRLATPATAVLADATMPGARWFPGATLNYTEQVFRHAAADHPALIFESETTPLTDVSWAELRRLVGAAAAGLRRLGVQPGDRVAAYLPNCPQSVVAFLACASLGAIWSSCSPDMGEGSVRDRFAQIEPKILFVVDGYRYGGKAFDRREIVAQLRADLPSLTRTVLVPYLNPAAQPADAAMMTWADLTAEAAEPIFTPVAFDHPLWILYSSGTTGLPKPIVQGQGGILLEHVKALLLHLDMRPQDRFFWFTTTSWMMWNFLVGGLLVGCTILLFDGSPGYPNMQTLWRFAEQSGMTFFGTSAAYITACIKAGIHPGAEFDLHRLRGIGSTGSPLSAEGFKWIYDEIHADLWLASISGGTDVCTAFVGGSPLLPVYAGEIQSRSLGCAVQAFDEQGHPVLDQVGELVVTVPMPSMPLFFWNDTDNRRYRESYFEMFPGIWRHGDWIKVTPRGGVIIYGRSDSTINRQGVRMGTAELYRAVEDLPEVLDSLVIDLEGLGGASFMAFFVVLAPGITLDDALKVRIKHKIRANLSARHVPDEVYAIAEVPRTLNGKKMETPIKRILMGQPPEKALNRDTMANPQTVDAFLSLADELRSRAGLARP